jgi:hypothetical protein
MPLTTANQPNRGQLYASIDGATVVRFVRSIHGEAERTFNAACAALRALGLLDRSDGPVFTFPIALLLKLGAMMRI